MSHDPEIAGSTAIVTGAASGIGAATAKLLAQQGASVVCADVNEAGLQGIVESIRLAGGQATQCLLDVTSEAAWQSAVEQALAAFGRLDVLVNSAGIALAKPVDEMMLEDWRKVLAINLDGVFLGTKYAVRAMRQQGRGGSIVNISSASGIRPPAGCSAYAASKAAVCMFTKAVAKECKERGDGIRINTICPGGVKTPMWSTQPFFQDLVRQTGSEDAAFQAMAAGTPGERFAEPMEIAQAVLYLVSRKAAYITGIDLVIDAGYVL